MGEVDIFFPNQINGGRNSGGRQSGGKDTKYLYMWDNKKNRPEIKLYERLIHCLAGHAQSRIRYGATLPNIDMTYLVKCYTELRMSSKQVINSNHFSVHH